MLNTYLGKFSAACVFLCSLLLTIPLAHAKQKEVLVLHSYHQGYQWTRDLQAGVESILGEQDIALYVSYLDSKRYFSDEYMELLTEAFARKFSHRDFDLVIVSDNNALMLAKNYGERLFPNTPVVFTGINHYTPALIDGMKKVTGVVESIELLDSISAALSLMPKTKDIYVIVDDTNSGQLLQRELDRIEPQIYPRMHVLHDETFLTLKQKVASIKGDAIIFYTTFSRDREGNFVEYDKMVQSLHDVANVPIFAAWDYTLGHGVVGGKMISGFSQGEKAARKALDVLNGVPVEAVLIDTKPENKYIFDANQLKRWQLNPADLPKESLIINQQIDEYDNYKENFLIVLAVIVCLCIIIALLQFNVVKQKRIHAELRASRARFSALFNEAFQINILLDSEAKVIQTNKAALSLLSLNEVDVMGKQIWQTPWWQHSKNEMHRLQQAIEQVNMGEFVRYESRQVNSAGATAIIDLSLKPVFDGNGQLELILLEGRDISSSKQAEIELRESEARYRVLHDENPSMLLTINAQGLILSCNRFGARLLAYSMDELVGKNVTLLHTINTTIDQQMAYLSQCASNAEGLLSRQIQYQTRLGETLWLQETTRKVPGKEQFFLVCEDITEKKLLSEQLSYQASHDFLTGLKNRNFFEAQLESYIESANEDNLVHALMYLDMDQFKVINDTCGHSAGDEVLKQLSTLLTDSLPQDALLARLGGDEFGVILANCEPSEALVHAHRMIDAVAEHHFISEEKTFSLGVSIGLVELNNTSGTKQYVMSCADTACYAAKDEGRNRVNVFKHDDQELQRRHGEMQWVNKVQQAMREQRFCLYAQPIKRISQDEDEYLHYEVLTRMIDENGKLAPPGLFIPAAENYNLADKLDRLIIDKTLLWLAGHPDHVAKLDLCSINLSGQSIGNKDFVEYLVQALQESKIPLDKICFEVTETVAIANFSHASHLLKELKKLGCKLALDDFGTGLSSFGYLKRLPVDYLKIDGLFVRDIADDEMDYAMVRSINEVSQLMGKQTIAECVEDERVLMRLSEIGVDYAQGYHLGKPMPIEMMALVSLAMD